MTVDLTDEDWKKKLTPEQYEVLRHSATEAPFTGQFLHNEEKGAYTCAACGAVLFMSDQKFDSGSGWPSFNDVAKSGAVNLVPDDSLGMHRTEVQCANCGSHLGHLFHDAVDQPTGDRFCINGVALGFAPSTETPAPPKAE
jgi:peptide-methionine (R)-S-oxide reductase